MTLRFLLDAARTHKRSLSAVFVDYSKASNSVDRRAIQVVLTHYGVPDPVVADVMQLYHGSSVADSTRFGLAETLDAISCVLQGDTLSPHIFILLVDYILKKSHVSEDGYTLKQANGHRHPAITLTALAYASNIAIISDSTSGAERTLRRLQL